MFRYETINNNSEDRKRRKNPEIRETQAGFITCTTKVLGGIAVAVAPLPGTSDVGAEEIGPARIVARFADITFIAAPIGILAEPDNRLLPAHIMPGAIIPVVAPNIRIGIACGQT